MGQLLFGSVNNLESQCRLKSQLSQYSMKDFHRLDESGHWAVIAGVTINGKESVWKLWTGLFFVSFSLWPSPARREGNKVCPTFRNRCLWLQKTQRFLWFDLFLSLGSQILSSFKGLSTLCCSNRRFTPQVFFD